ncbi:MAG: GatB/YqeY domain-containing protein [Coxiellaceae bacterium]|nr:GatB/YqeY domain-containing protein [Coxiellaceae bacterium]
MSLKEQIRNDMKDAMRAKETDRLGTIRMLIAAIKQKEIDEQIELEDNQVLSVINKMIKQRRDSVEQFEKAERQELADKEKVEIATLQTYMPKQLDEQEISDAVEQAITKTGAASIKDMGKVMGMLQSSLSGRADMSVVSQLVKQKLTP